jgi:CheY-like chemotaxis protein
VGISCAGAGIRLREAGNSRIVSESRESLRILVVEDEALILMAAVDTLAELGHEGVSASTGKAALSVLQGNDAIHAMLVDINLPDMDGKQIAAEARRLRPGLPIIFATGYRIDVPEDLAQTGPTVVLGKPYWMPDLERAIRQVC